MSGQCRYVSAAVVSKKKKMGLSWLNSVHYNIPSVLAHTVKP